MWMVPKDDDWKFDNFMDQLFFERYTKLFFNMENLSSYDAFYIVKHNLHRIQAFVYATNFGVRIHFCHIVHVKVEFIALKIIKF